MESGRCVLGSGIWRRTGSSQRFGSRPKSGKGLGDSFPLPEQVTSIRRQIVEAIDVAGRPSDFNRLDTLAGPKAKMGSGIDGRGITSPAKVLEHLAFGTGDQRKFRANRFSVRGRSFEPESDEMCAPGLVVKVERWLIVGNQHRVDAA